MTQGEIDTAVAERLRAGNSLYEVDERLLRELAPDLILTQTSVRSARPGNEVSQALDLLPESRQILWLTPNSFGTNRS